MPTDCYAPDQVAPERGIEEEKGVERGKEERRKKCNTKAWRHKVEHFYENQLAVATVQYTD